MREADVAILAHAVDDPRVHLVGYGPSASTIGANRAGRAAVHELTRYLDDTEVEIASAADQPRAS
jgi:hypothetical protein